MDQPDRKRRHRTATTNRLCVGLIGLAALAAAAGCTVEPIEGAEPVPDGEAVDAAQLVEMVNESQRLDKELDAAEDRIIAECLEEQGFDVHDKRELGQYEVYEVDSLADSYPADEFLPEVAIAAEWGFGWWAQTEEMFDSEETQEYYEEAFDFPGEDEPVFENDAFESLPDDERRAWRVAYEGEEATAALEGTGGPEGGGSGEDGSLDFDGEIAGGPKPGGCKLEMIEALYGGLEQVAIGDEGDYLDWVWRPESPVVDLDAVEADYAASTAGDQEGFLACITERGYPDWEFDDRGTLAMLDYSSLLYTGEVFEEEPIPGQDPVVDTSPDVPDLPEDVPADFEGKRAYEVDMAVDFAECGDETGYRDAAKEAFDAALAARYAEIEAETYAWQDEIRGYTAAAQELIGA